MKGVALIFTVLLMLLLSLFAFLILMFSGSHYFASRSLVEQGNARIACEMAATTMVDDHNFAPQRPRFFFNAANWKATSLKPFAWNGYEVDVNFEHAWNSTTTNPASIKVSKGKFISRSKIELTQRRMEDFALYSESSQQLLTGSVFDGLVFSREKLQLQQPDVRFLQFVQAPLDPSDHAVLMRKTEQHLEYPVLSEFLKLAELKQRAIDQGIVIDHTHRMWDADHFELNLDRIDLQRHGGGWRIYYEGTLLGESQLLYLWFEGGPVRIRQTHNSVGFLPASKPLAPLNIGTSGDLILFGSVRPVQSLQAEHPLCLISGGSIVVDSAAPRATRIKACLVALGVTMIGETAASVILSSEGSLLSNEEKEDLLEEVRGSALLLHDTKRDAMITAINSDQRVVWFRGSVLVQGQIVIPANTAQVHFEASREQFSLIPPLPFVYITEGSRRWL